MSASAWSIFSFGESDGINPGQAQRYARPLFECLDKGIAYRKKDDEDREKSLWRSIVVFPKHGREPYDKFIKASRPSSGKRFFYAGVDEPSGGLFEYSNLNDLFPNVAALAGFVTTEQQHKKKLKKGTIKRGWI